MATMNFGVGAAKTGSHSLAGMFSGAIPVAHEPHPEAFLHLVLDHAEGKLSDAELRGGVVRLIVDVGAHLNVAAINGYLIRTVFSAFPESRYVLTLREPESWLRSFINHQLTHSPPPTSRWYAFRELRFARHGTPHTPEDAALQKRGLYSLNSYLGYWLKHNLAVIETIPQAQLFIAPTSSLRRDACRIVSFLGLPPESADADQSHLFRGDYREPSPLDELPPGYLQERVSAYSAALLAQTKGRLDGTQLDFLCNALAVPKPEARTISAG